MCFGTPRLCFWTKVAVQTVSPILTALELPEPGTRLATACPMLQRSLRGDLQGWRQERLQALSSTWRLLFGPPVTQTRRGSCLHTSLSYTLQTWPPIPSAQGQQKAPGGLGVWTSTSLLEQAEERWLIVLFTRPGGTLKRRGTASARPKGGLLPMRNDHAGSSLVLQ